MQLQTLIQKLSKYGTVQAIKKGLVFTVLITGSGLTKQDTVINIQKLVIGFAKDYPFIEVMKNENEFFLIILKPKTNV